jgi:prolyl oligopeptidase
VLYGYGGFEISLTPSLFRQFRPLWLTHGGLYVVANIRGGGEFGPAWHQAATQIPPPEAPMTISQPWRPMSGTRGLTTPKQLGIMGGSNGGLLVSA